MSGSKVIFVGLGSPHGDDCVGWLVAERLQVHSDVKAAVRRAAAPADILDWLDGTVRMAICDGCQGAGPVGSWHRWKWPLIQRATRAGGSHDFSLLSVMQLAAQLGILPEEVVLWGVEIRQANPTESVSEEVAAAVPAVTNDVASFLSCRHA